MAFKPNNTYDLCSDCYNEDNVLKHKKMNPLIKSSVKCNKCNKCNKCDNLLIHYECRECYGNFYECESKCNRIDLHIYNYEKDEEGIDRTFFPTNKENEGDEYDMGLIQIKTSKSPFIYHTRKKHDFRKVEMNVVIDQDRSYQYFINMLYKLNDDIYCYIIRQNNYNESYLDIEFILKVYYKGKIIIEKELLTHNPYFGFYVSYIDYDLNKQIIHIIYQEKHYECEMFVQVDVDNDNSHTTFIKKGQECGTLIKFIKDGKEQKNYWTI